MSNIGTEINGELFFGPNIIDAARDGYRLRTRVSDLVFSYPFIKKIHVEVEINPHFTIVSLPDAKTLDNQFFSYSSNVSGEGHNVTFDSTYQFKPIRVSPEEYKAFRNSFKKYLKAAKAQVVLK